MTEHEVIIPAQLPLYQRGEFPAGALPGIGAVITVPVFATDERGVASFLNHQDNSSPTSTLRTGTHALRRYVGLYLVDVFLFQDQPATIALGERIHDEAMQLLPGIADNFRVIYTRQVRANVPFRQTWRLYGQEARIRYTNGAAAVTARFQFSVVARAS